jgi:hypothetical protein
MIGRASAIVTALLVLATLVVASLARADEVDDAYVAGNEAAAREDWPAAVEAYRRAEALLPERSAVLAYDLGTAYLEAGDLGRATLHLRRALDFRGGPTTEVVEAARFNLGVARRRAELAAAAGGTKIDRPDGWWDLVLEALRAPGVGWFSLIAGWAALAVLVLHTRRRRAGRPTAVTGVSALVLSVVWLVPGVLHGLALREDRTSPVAIVLPDRADARDGPGNHRHTEFSIQGGSRVRIVDRAPGWRRIRMSGGLEGWVPEDDVAEVERPAAPPRVSTPR